MESSKRAFYGCTIINGGKVLEGRRRDVRDQAGRQKQASPHSAANKCSLACYISISRLSSKEWGDLSFALRPAFGLWKPEAWGPP